jgi:hypothetical protein
MTDKEHALIMMMFTRQNLYIQMLLNMLKRDGIIEGDDIQAFDSAVISDPDNVSALHRVTNQYRSFANQLEMDVPELASLIPDKI